MSTDCRLFILTFNEMALILLRAPIIFTVSSLDCSAGNNKKLSYGWETVRRESMPRIAEMDVEMTTKAEMTFKCTSRSSKVAPIES